MKKLIIDRKRWIRGEKDSFLLREEDRKMCCLGFYSRSCRMKASDILNEVSPGNISNKLSSQMQWLTEDGLNTADAIMLMRHNDSQNCDEHRREQEIAAIFAKHDVEVTFIN